MSETKDKEQEYLWLLQNRISRIFNVITQYGEENFYISFSGGVDSTILSVLVDMALPSNKIPRVFADTGIELNAIKEFVSKFAEKDGRIVIIKPEIPIKQMLEEKGYPFKSKKHSQMWDLYNRNPESENAAKYANREHSYGDNKCPKCLQYQFSKDYKGVKISDKCCEVLKKGPLHNWQKENNKPYAIVGVRKSEGGRRGFAKCLSFTRNKLKNFQPLVEVTNDWELWYIKKYNIEICNIYNPPYNFERTGCKGCPLNLHIQKDLDTLKKFFPAEHRQCEMIWKPVYDEYRRIGYRLKKDTEKDKGEIK